MTHPTTRPTRSRRMPSACTTDGDHVVGVIVSNRRATTYKQVLLSECVVVAEAPLPEPWGAVRALRTSQCMACVAGGARWGADGDATSDRVFRTLGALCAQVRARVRDEVLAPSPPADCVIVAPIQPTLSLLSPLFLFFASFSFPPPAAMLNLVDISLVVLNPHD